MQLTAIDYTENKNRDYARDEEGNMRFQKLFNKRTKMWRPVPIKVPKSFLYMRGIFIDMLQLRIDHRKNNVAIHRKKRMDEFDPRNIRHTIAPVSPESIRVLVEKRQSRFGDHKRSRFFIPLSVILGPVLKINCYQCYHHWFSL